MQTTNNTQPLTSDMVKPVSPTRRPVEHTKDLSIPGVAFTIAPSRMDRFPGAMGTVLNHTNRPKSEVFQYLLGCGKVNEAIDSAYLWLSDAYPGFYFGFIGPNESGRLQYGWIIEGQLQYGSEA